MKSVRLHGTGDLQIHEEPIPIAGVGEKLIHIKSVGVCGSDLHWFSEGSIGDAKLNRPLVLGHEFSGETEDGQRVTIDPAISCGHCEHGHPHSLGNKFEITTANHGDEYGSKRYPKSN